MAIEQSVLNREIIADILIKEWQIGVSSIATVQNNTAPIHRNLTDYLTS